MVLVRLARQGEVGEGAKLLKESHGRQLLLVRKHSAVFCTDAHCFHMGGQLWQGDIEDCGEHTCIVCPLHRYRIDMKTGQKVDTDLAGCVSCSGDQKQRTYQVHCDPDHIWVDIPDLQVQTGLPSDRYNQVAFAQLKQQQQPVRSAFGLSGAAPSSQPAQPPTPLQPYAGFQQRGLLPSPEKLSQSQEEPSLQLSQQGGLQFTQPQAPSPMQQQPPPGATSAAQQQGRIPFTQSRPLPAHVMRRKAATEAIARRAYQPPTAPRQGRGLDGSPAPGSIAPAAAAPLQRQGSGQQSLFAFGFTTQPRAAAAGGAEDMDME